MQDSLEQATRVSRSVAENVRKTLIGKTDQEKQEDKILADSDRIWAYLSSSRKRAEYEWWLNDQFYQGEQYVSYNFTTNRIERATNPSSNQLVINLINKTARHVVSFLNREHPQAKVLPGVEDEGAYIRAKKQEHLLDYWYNRLSLNKVSKQITLDAYKYKVGWAKVIWDRSALAPTSPYKMKSGAKSTKTYGELSVERVDTFEVWWDPMAHEVKDMRFICHALPRTLGELRANKNYMNRDKLTSDSKLAASYMKEAWIRSQTVGAAQFTPTGGSDYSTVIVRELFHQKTDPETGLTELWITVSTATGVLLRHEKWDGPNPWVMYPADVQGSLLEGGGPLRHMRSPQKALNQMNTIIQENARITGKIQMYMPRGSNINVIDDVVGSFVEYDPTPGGKPEQNQPAGLPAYMPNHIDRLEKYLDDLGGNHSASYGKSPGSKASGELVNKLQEGDSNNLTMMQDNLDDFWVNLCKTMLWTFKHNAKTDRLIRLNQQDAVGNYNFTKVAAEDVSLEDDVQVVTGSNMPYSLADKQEMFLNMWHEKAITDPKLLFKAMEMPDLDNQLGSQQLDIERALRENKMVLNGKIPPDPVKGEDHQVHMTTHAQFIRSQMFEDAPLEVKNNIMAHYDKHINLNYQLTMISNSMNVAPITRSEIFQVRAASLGEFTPQEATQFEAKFGVQSDRLQIQQRGGVTVTNPAMAEQQAQAEDLTMMEGAPVPISIADNHQVHIETHSQLTKDPRWATVPQAVQQVLTQHIKDHETAMRAQMTTPGLVPAPNYDNPNKPSVIKQSNVKPPPSPQPDITPVQTGGSPKKVSKLNLANAQPSPQPRPVGVRQIRVKGRGGAHRTPIKIKQG